MHCYMSRGGLEQNTCSVVRYDVSDVADGDLLMLACGFFAELLVASYSAIHLRLPTRGGATGPWATLHR